MVAAITTYMVIFIQFMPKEDPTKTAIASLNATISLGNISSPIEGFVNTTLISPSTITGNI